MKHKLIGLNWLSGFDLSTHFSESTTEATGLFLPKQANANDASTTAKKRCNDWPTTATSINDGTNGKKRWRKWRRLFTIATVIVQQRIECFRWNDAATTAQGSVNFSRQSASSVNFAWQPNVRHWAKLSTTTNFSGK